MMWFGISVPLVFVGSYFGDKRGPVEHPVRTNKIPRQIPPQPWYMHPVFAALAGGVLPFGAVFIELFFILTSMWLHQVYYIFGILSLVYVILLVTCAEIAVVLCYFQLCAEDYHWWWRSFFASGSSALYVFLYSGYYFVTKLDITRITPTVMYFAYMALLSAAIHDPHGDGGVPRVSQVRASHLRLSQDRLTGRERSVDARDREISGRDGKGWSATGGVCSLIIRQVDGGEMIARETLVYYFCERDARYYRRLCGEPPRSSLARARWRLLVEPGLVAALVGGDTLGEPQGDLVLGGLDGVGTVDDVAAKLDAVIAADGAGLGGAEEGGQNGEGRSGSAAGRRWVRAKGRDARRRYGARRRDGGRSARVRARVSERGRNWRRSAGTDRIAEDRARWGSRTEGWWRR